MRWLITTFFLLLTEFNLSAFEEENKLLCLILAGSKAVVWFTTFVDSQLYHFLDKCCAWYAKHPSKLVFRRQHTPTAKGMHGTYDRHGYMNRFPRKSHVVLAPHTTMHFLLVILLIPPTTNNVSLSFHPIVHRPTTTTMIANQQRWRLVYNFPIRYAACNGEKMKMHHQAAGDLALHYNCSRCIRG